MPLNLYTVVLWTYTDDHSQFAPLMLFESYYIMAQTIHLSFLLHQLSEVQVM